MKILISGGTGFIGTHLKKRLIARGDTVVLVPRSYLMNKSQLERFFRSHNPDYIFHLAAYGVKSHQKDTDEITKVNINGTLHMLSASLSIPYKAFINVGSAFEYGKKSHPMKETDLPEPVEMYGATKVAATYLAQAFAKQYKKPIITVRPLSVYGEGDSPDRFTQLIIKAILTEKKLEYCPTPVHDWIYVEDVVDAMIHIAENIEKINSIAVNIGTQKQHTNKEFLETLVHVSGMKNTDLFIPSKKERATDSSRVSYADTSLLRSLGWTPKYSLSDGLLKTFMYYKTNNIVPHDEGVAGHVTHAVSQLFRKVSTSNNIKGIKSLFLSKKIKLLYTR